MKTGDGESSTSRMRRRGHRVKRLLGAATLAARAVRAQQKAMPVIGISVPGVRSGAATCNIAYLFGVPPT